MGETTIRKIRLYEIARQLGMPTEEVVDKLRACGELVTSANSTVHVAVAEAFKAKVRAGSSRRPATSPVVRRRPAIAPPVVAPAAPVSPTVQAAPAPTPPAAPALETLDVRTRYEHALAAARGRAEARQRELAVARPQDEPAEVTSRRLRIVDAPARAVRRPDRRKHFAGTHGRPLALNPAASAFVPTTPAEHKRVVRIESSISVDELARAIGVKAAELLSRLWRLGSTTATLNSILDLDTATVLASELGYEVRDVAFREEVALETAPDRPEDLVPRAPVVTVMGHVDHGKTSLLDAIRSSRVAAGEAGGITQHIGASRVTTSAGELVFIDTPGHEAFAAMRARGARMTDLVVLAVAADDGVMPQTLEALDHAREAGVPIVVAVTKCDLPAARPDRIRSQLAEHGLVPEAWGGDTQYIDVSAWTGDGLGMLLEAIAVQAAVLELRANVDKPAVGIVIEARLDRGRGPIVSALIQQGTLHRGDTIVCGEHVGRVRALVDASGRPAGEAGPSSPVEILGLDGVPTAGDSLRATDELAARRVAAHRREQRKRREQGTVSRASADRVRDKLQSRDKQPLRLVVKADTRGTGEALRDALCRLSSNEVPVDVVRAAVGAITESDVHLAIAANARLLGFRVGAAGKASALARHEGITVQLHDVIYDAIDAVRAAIAGLLPVVEHECELGRLEVREVFRVSGVGRVAGCSVVRGAIRRGALVRVRRQDEIIHEGRVASLRRFQENVAEVAQGYECGLTIAQLDDIRSGDVIEAYELVRSERAAA